MPLNVTGAGIEKKKVFYKNVEISPRWVWCYLLYILQFFHFIVLVYISLCLRVLDLVLALDNRPLGPLVLLRADVRYFFSCGGTSSWHFIIIMIIIFSFAHHQVHLGNKWWWSYIWRWTGCQFKVMFELDETIREWFQFFFVFQTGLNLIYNSPLSFCW